MFNLTLFFALRHRKLTADMETTKIALENERKIQQLQMQAINALWKKVSNMPTAAVTVAAAAAATTALPATSSAVDVAANDASGLLLGSNQSQAIVQDLAKTCSVLTSQVQQLQGSMHDILQCMTVFCQLPQQQQQQQQPVQEAAPPPRPTVTSMVADTQTEIVAVHTPQVDQLPFPFRSRFAGVPPTPSTTTTTSCGVGTTPPPAVRLQRPSTLTLDATVGPSTTTPPNDDDDDDDAGADDQTSVPNATTATSDELADDSVVGDADRLPTKSVE